MSVPSTLLIFAVEVRGGRNRFEDRGISRRSTTSCHLSLENYFQMTSPTSFSISKRTLA